jgi:hypothetical protein
MTGVRKKDLCKVAEGKGVGAKVAERQALEDG